MKASVYHAARGSHDELLRPVEPSLAGAIGRSSSIGGCDPVGVEVDAFFDDDLHGGSTADLAGRGLLVAASVGSSTSSLPFRDR